MHFLKVYGRVFGLLGKDARVAALLCVANLIVAALSFLDPVLFGRVIQLLAGSDTMPETELWRRATYLLGIWAAIGAAGIVANMTVALYSERLAHRNRLQIMSRFTRMS